MASLSSAILCDFAQVREGLLMVVSGGITRMYRTEIPAQSLVMVAAIVEVPYEEIGLVHEVTLSVTQPATAERLARVTGGFQAGTHDLEPGESLYVPVVLDIRSVVIPTFGPVDVQVCVDGGVGTMLTCYVRPAVAQPEH